MATSYAGERIRTARLLFGLTQGELAHAAQVSQTLISHVEKGHREATDELLDAIAAAVATPRSFFDVIPETIPLGSLRFRRNATASQKDTNRATALFAEAFRVIVQLITPVGYPTPAVPRPQAHLTGDDIEELAEQAREALQLSPDAPIPHVTRALERAGIAIVPIVLPSREPAEEAATPGHFGLSYWPGPAEHALIGYFPGSKADRDRFTLAHELGHIVLHTHRAAADPEAEANRFASAFLMPRGRAVEVLDQRLVLSDYARLKAIWGMSIQALIMRGTDIGLIDRVRSRSLSVQLSARGWRRNEPVTVHPEEPQLLWRLLTIHYGKPPYRRAVDPLAIPAVILRSLAPAPSHPQSPPTVARPRRAPVRQLR
jgi:Zn-dependent peptidase ImmA (M78 family)/DNA-binding XRE family transcriptional regulator